MATENVIWVTWDRPSVLLRIKRLFDFLFALVLLMLLFPLLMVLGLFVKLTSRGPVFYCDERVGQNGRLFRMYKFRTMYRDADRIKHQLLDQNEMSGPVFKMRRDPRVTPLGFFLRKHSLDELPQLWNILRGDMSMVGPRPPLPKEVEQYEPWHRQRLLVKPGATCLWQILGRNDIAEFDEWVRLDLHYIQNWSLRLDFKIVCRTVWAVIRGTGC
ncbi:MAG: exopolysaccharide biosynthesis polyprenyl glycosylphosphotransferase [Deltaproteobacteria bacterium]|nr:exopolysaccharide biosynthesis polyprenyl glycosylphosphotransferase [Deltaproteobacteria bacterium]